ncbi:MAG TPA: Scr1 family TA system antitoxin-like transcriptional regulator, partial [Jatrophihabitantaceae bacterium]|nr:Scr1 family TA system antitoxin-like transcriptional regulator [Jatrophihabitantaceae bacterium]
RFPEPDLPDLVYLEQLDSATYLDGPDQVAQYLSVMNEICVQALPKTASKHMLGDLLEQA